MTQVDVSGLSPKALAELEWRVLRAEEVDRDNRRRPKKYYAAARVADRRG